MKKLIRLSCLAGLVLLASACEREETTVQPARSVQKEVSATTPQTRPTESDSIHLEISPTLPIRVRKTNLRVGKVLG
ncbi:hypothetical protein [Spirosoma montaniterrae]|uniref:hypothetical protein n=1 Tax=Spirosoma montaniterrae TaxID=1178516 RepID=UPI0012F978C4|nr:hypothetical protein [Spirosoma montaniterrae]